MFLNLSASLSLTLDNSQHILRLLSDQLLVVQSEKISRKFLFLEITERTISMIAVLSRKDYGISILSI